MIATMPASPNKPIVDAILRLFGFGYGHARFEVNEAGELVEAATVVTVKKRPDESIELFVRRLRADYDWRKGDTLEIISNGGKLDVARITRMPRA